MKKYKLIVVDPPWPVKKIIRRVRPNQKANLDYDTMSINQIKSLPIDSIAKSNSVCFLWTIQKYLPISFGILEGWGFRYQRTLTWDKKNGLCLFGFHHRTEFILFGYRGKLEMYPKRKAIPTILAEYSNIHSRKPDVFYEKVASFGEPRIDLFARTKREGWDVWGDEVESDINLMRHK